MKPLYKRTANGAIQQWEVHVLRDTYTTRSGKHGGVLTSHTTTCKPKNVGRSNATSGAEQAQKEALAKWTKKIEREQYVDDLSKIDSAPSFFAPMLALDATKVPHRIDWKNKRYFTQPKLNGVRCIATYEYGVVTLTSRKGKKYRIPHIEKEVKEMWENSGTSIFLIGKPIHIDGELYIHGTQLGDITHAVANQDPDLQFHIFDIVIHLGESNGWHRQDNISDLFRAKNIKRQHHLRRVPCDKVNNMEEFQKAHDFYVSKGYEGAMLRDLGAEYQCGKKTPALFKLKAFQDSEFEVIDIEADKTGAALLTLVTDTGTTFKSRPMGSQDQKLMMVAYKDKIIGKMATVRYSTLLNSGAPEFNRVVAIRDYE